jgi:hypothetical protein
VERELHMLWVIGSRESVELTMAIRVASLYADGLVRSRPDGKTAIEMLPEHKVEDLRANTKELGRLVLDLRTQFRADLGLSPPDHSPTGRRRRCAVALSLPRSRAVLRSVLCRPVTSRRAAVSAHPDWALHAAEAVALLAVVRPPVGATISAALALVLPPRRRFTPRGRSPGPRRGVRRGEVQMDADDASAIGARARKIRRNQ